MSEREVEREREREMERWRSREREKIEGEREKKNNLYNNMMNIQRKYPSTYFLLSSVKSIINLHGGDDMSFLVVCNYAIMMEEGCNKYCVNCFKWINIIAEKDKRSRKQPA